MKDVREYLDSSIDEDFREKRSVERIDVFNTSAQLSLDLVGESTGLIIKGLVVNLSSQGCCIVFNSEIIPGNYSFVRVSIGQQTNIPAQIRWLQQVERGIFKMGLCYQL